MTTNNSRVETRLRIWSAAVDKREYCEICRATATYSSRLIEDEVCTEVHWHCDGHAYEIIRALKKRSRSHLTAIVRDRHWMHIWKVGFKQCAECYNDSRVVATYLDQSGKEVEQLMYCKFHAPELTSLPSDNIEDQVKYGLGASFTVTSDTEESEGEE